MTVPEPFGAHPCRSRERAIWDTVASRYQRHAVLSSTTPRAVLTDTNQSPLRR